MAVKKVYLIDTENVGVSWKQLLNHIGVKDQLFLFYTEHSPHLAYTDLENIVSFQDSFEMIQCFPGRNGLDFQLVSYLGFQIKSAPKVEYVIISKDSGYDPVCKFWQSKGYEVSRKTAAEAVNGSKNIASGVLASVKHIFGSNSGTRSFKTTMADNKAIESQSTITTSVKRGSLPEQKTVITTNIKQASNTGTQADISGRRVSIDRKPAQTPKKISTQSVLVNNTSDTISEIDVSMKPKKTLSPKKSVDTKTTPKKSADAKAAPKMSAEVKVTPKKATDVKAVASQNVQTKQVKSVKVNNLIFPENKVLINSLIPAVYHSEAGLTAKIINILELYDLSQLQPIYCEFVKVFGQEKGSSLYKATKPHYKKLRTE